MASQYFADFFINEARKNQQRFENKSEEAARLIYNYAPEYTGAFGSAFVQQYLFEAKSAAAANLGSLRLLALMLPLLLGLAKMRLIC